MSYETTTGVQKLCHELNFPVTGPYIRSSAIKMTLSAKKLINRLAPALGLNNEKLIVLVEHQKCSDESDFLCVS